MHSFIDSSAGRTALLERLPPDNCERPAHAPGRAMPPASVTTSPASPAPSIHAGSRRPTWSSVTGRVVGWVRSLANALNGRPQPAPEAAQQPADPPRSVRSGRHRLDNAVRAHDEPAMQQWLDSALRRHTLPELWEKSALSGNEDAMIAMLTILPEETIEELADTRPSERFLQAANLHEQRGVGLLHTGMRELGYSGLLVDFLRTIRPMRHAAPDAPRSGQAFRCRHLNIDGQGHAPTAAWNRALDDAGLQASPLSEPQARVVRTADGLALHLERLGNAQAMAQLLDTAGCQTLAPGTPVSVTIDRQMKMGAADGYASLRQGLELAGFEDIKGHIVPIDGSPGLYQVRCEASRRERPPWEYQAAPAALAALHPAILAAIPREPALFVRDPTEAPITDAFHNFLGNAQEAGEEFAVFFSRGNYGADAIRQLSQRMNRLVYYGRDDNRVYRHDVQKAGELDHRTKRTYTLHANGRANLYAAEVARHLSLQPPLLNERVPIPGVRVEHWPSNHVNSPVSWHAYPVSAAFDEYFAQGGADLTQCVRLATGGQATRAEVRDAIADYYHTMINPQYHPQINNTLRMMELNFLLRWSGISEGVSHGHIDLLAMRFSREDFRQIFAAHLEGRLPSFTQRAYTLRPEAARPQRVMV
jgi:hypothetical protein